MPSIIYIQFGAEPIPNTRWSWVLSTWAATLISASQIRLVDYSLLMMCNGVSHAVSWAKMEAVGKRTRIQATADIDLYWMKVRIECHDAIADQDCSKERRQGRADKDDISSLNMKSVSWDEQIPRLFLSLSIASINLLKGFSHLCQYCNHIFTIYSNVSRLCFMSDCICSVFLRSIQKVFLHCCCDHSLKIKFNMAPGTSEIGPTLSTPCAFNFSWNNLETESRL